MLDEHLTRCDILMCLNNGCRESLEKPTDMREHINNEQHTIMFVTGVFMQNILLIMILIKYSQTF